MRKILVLVLTIAGCVSSSPSKERAQDREKIKNELGSEMSLKEDRATPDAFRKDTPAETRKQNDEMALHLNLMKQGTESPAAVRDKFQSLIRKKRTEFREKSRKLRDDYRGDETKRRDEFLNAQKTKRDAFMRRKRDSAQTRAFTGEQEKARAAFFSDERARRQNFESDMNAQSKDFDAYMRERQKEFDEQYRQYSKKFSERPKEKNAVTGDDFKRLEETPASPLGTED